MSVDAYSLELAVRTYNVHYGSFSWQALEWRGAKDSLLSPGVFFLPLSSTFLSYSSHLFLLPQNELNGGLRCAPWLDPATAHLVTSVFILICFYNFIFFCCLGVRGCQLLNCTS